MLGLLFDAIDMIEEKIQYKEAEYRTKRRKLEEEEYSESL